MTTTLAETEFRRGWPAVLACFCVAVFAWGFGFYGQAVFLAQLQRMHGWSTSTIAAATTVYYFCGALLIPFVSGGNADPLGCTMMGRIGFTSAADPWQLFVAGMVMAAGWAASSGPAIATTLALWFDRRRGFAISLALNGASASGFTIAPLLVQWSHTIGLRHAVMQAVLAGWLVVIPIISAVRCPVATGAAMAVAVGDRPDRRRVTGERHCATGISGRWLCRSRWRSRPRWDLSCIWWRCCCLCSARRAPASP